MSKIPVRLTNAERDSAAWQKVDHVLSERLIAFRAKVENPQLSEADRLAYCWRIHELKELLKLASQPTEPQQDAG